MALSPKSLSWVREERPTWDDARMRVVGRTPAGVFDLPQTAPGQVVPGEWWRVEDEGRVVGYGWMDQVWGEGEILLAVDPDARGHGVGSFILDRLEAEAASRGLRYVYNSVRPTHPQRQQVSAWLRARGFSHADHGDRLQRQVRSAGAA